jgi:hypothetical protein
MNEHRWAHLGRRARAFRVAHAAFSIVQLAALGYVWFCAATRRRDRVLTSSAAALLVEGAALVIGRGDCPFGPLQARLGDPVPLFELVLPRRAAKAAIPALFLVAVGGLVATLLRPPEGWTPHGTTDMPPSRAASTEKAQPGRRVMPLPLSDPCT